MYDSFKIRGNIILTFMGLVFIIFIGRLFFIQVINDEYRKRANRYVIKRKAIVPPRGNIYDRKGHIYVSNSPIFDIKITPRELNIKDTNLLVQALGMEIPEINQRIEDAKKFSSWKESTFAQYIEPEIYGQLEEKLWEFEGISFSATTKRDYKHQVGANILGYISEVSAAEVEASPGEYMSGDLIGKAGIEKRYDSILRGKQGVKMVEKDVHNREIGSYKGGDLDQPAIKGKDIILGIDTKLQAYGELLMQNKTGSIVAIEPQSGEILAFVSAPTYEPHSLTGKELQTNWRILSNDPLKPLYNRPLQAAYPPGSIFKVAVALAALNEGIITPETRFRCGGGFWRNKGKPGCRMHPHPLDLEGALRYSCNSYFSAIYMDYLHHNKYRNIYEGYQSWHDYMADMGVGKRLSIDLPYESKALLPTTARYDKYYGENSWGATNIISNAIGQGEILMTPLQMANMAALVANRGYYIEPHIVSGSRGEDDQTWVSFRHEKVSSKIARTHYNMVADAMEQVVSNGTAGRARIDGVSVCGKTGTSQNPHGDSHAVFMAFAPKEKPRIAIAVILENAGGGGTWAAPTASLMIEKYLILEGYIKREAPNKYKEARVLNANFIQKK